MFMFSTEMHAELTYIIYEMAIDVAFKCKLLKQRATCMNESE